MQSLSKIMSTISTKKKLVLLALIIFMISIPIAVYLIWGKELLKSRVSSSIQQRTEVKAEDQVEELETENEEKELLAQGSSGSSSSFGSSGSSCSAHSRSDSSCSGSQICLGTSDKGDAQHVFSPGLVRRSASSYLMWYSGYNGAHSWIFKATSSGGGSWQKTNNDIPPDSSTTSDGGRIPVSESGFLDDKWVGDPDVFEDKMVICSGDEVGTNNFYMYYTAYDEVSLARRIFAAGSSGGDSWEKARLQVDKGKPDSETDVEVEAATTILDIYSKFCCACPPYGKCCCEGARRYHMWYAGYDGADWGIFYLSSSTPLWWGNSQGQKVIGLGSKGSGYDKAVSHPSVVLQRDFGGACCGSLCIESDRTFHMWFSGYDGQHWRIFYTTSKDGRSFNSPQMVLEPGEEDCVGDSKDVLAADVESDAGTRGSTINGPPFIMFYTGYDGSRKIIYKATSQDGSSWTKADNSVQ